MLPEFSVGPFVSLPTYFVYLSLLSSAWIYIVWLWAEKTHTREDIALNAAMILLVAGALGGRLFHVFYEAPDYYSRFPTEAFKVWRGGFVFFGGFFLALVCSWLYMRFTKESFANYFDFFAPLLALGYGAGRGACLLAGCCYGSYCDLPWAINYRHPTQLYAILIELTISYILFRRAWLVVQKRKAPWPPGCIGLLWICLHSLGRLFMEHFREDFRGPALQGLSISSWISLGLLASSLAGLFYLGILPRLSQTLMKKKK